MRSMSPIWKQNPPKLTIYWIFINPIKIQGKK